MPLNIKRYGKSFRIKTTDGFEFEFNKIQRDCEDNEIVFYNENNVSARIVFTIKMHDELVNFMK